MPPPSAAPRNEDTRRTQGARTQGRSAKIVQRVLTATAVELGRVGFAALRIDDVADRSGVNKTTIYRRWPTKPELVAAALRALTQPPDAPDTGSLRGDLLAHFGRLAELSHSRVGRGVVRTLQVERMHPELEPVRKQLRGEQRALRVSLFERAVARGELPGHANLELLAEVAAAPMLARVMNGDADLDEAFIQAVVDLLLVGAGSKPSPKKPR